MDGSAGVKCSGKCPAQPQFRYVDNSAIGMVTPYLQMATQYGWANYMFQTNQGPSFPAHQFIFGGTSAPTASDDARGIFASENMSGTSTAAGCTAPPGPPFSSSVPTGENQKIYPCFEHLHHGRPASRRYNLAILCAQRGIDLDRAQCDSAYLPVHGPRGRVRGTGLVGKRRSKAGGCAERYRGV